MNYGFIKSSIDRSESKFVELKGLDLPDEYSYEKFLPKVLNQGDKPICVPCSLSAHINWNKNVDDGLTNTNDCNIKLDEIYASRTTGGNNGMSFKDALHFLVHIGVNSDLGNLKIERYSMITSEKTLKQALLLNGPCVAALPVYNNTDYFWRKNENDAFMGGHAISIVGFDKKGFIIRNSWGNSFGKNGYTHIDYDEFKFFYEIWTLCD